MEHTQAPDFPVVTLFASHIVGADRDYLHIVKPLYEFLTVLESRLVELTVGKERAGALLVVAIEPAVCSTRMSCFSIAVPCFFAAPRRSSRVTPSPRSRCFLPRYRAASIRMPRPTTP